MKVDQLLAPFRPPTTNLVQRLQYWAEQLSDQAVFYFLNDGENDNTSISYRQLDQRARGIAAELQSSGMKGERALLLFPPGLEFVTAFFGCLYAEVIAVPAYPPRRNRNQLRIQGIADDCDAKLALTVEAILERSKTALNSDETTNNLNWIATDSIPIEQASGYKDVDISNQSLAFLQYTSGSTGSPKGVMLSHGNIMHNCSLITTAFQATRADFGMSWLPTYHDMGLVGGVLNPLYCGSSSLLMSPMLFLQKPLRWLQAISTHGVTISGGPNFAYDLCTKKTTDQQLEQLDLSSWSLAFNGAEPVRPRTMQKFIEKFARCGFRPETFYPCYGMAETTLFVSGGGRGRKPTVRCFDGSELDEGHVIAAAPDGDRGRMVVGSGSEIGNEEILIVDPDTQTKLSDGRVGEIWIRSDSVGQGYWNKPEATETTFLVTLADAPDQKYLRSGDLGFFDRGELFVTGRLKDMIIVRGVNRYPQDIEMTVERADRRLRNGAAAAFAVEIDGQERLVIVSEVERRENDDWDDVIDAIRRDVTTEHELPPEGIILVRSGSIPKTSSGKIQRHACRTGFQNDTLLTVAKRITWETNGNGKPRNHVTQTTGTQVTDTSQVDSSVIGVVIQKVKSIANERVKEVTADSNIVHMGLDSLERMEIINELEDHFGGHLPESVLPQIETCQDVADAITQFIGDKPTSKAKRLESIPEEYYRFDKMTEYVQLKRNMQMLQSTGVPNPYFRRHQSVTRDTTMIEGREMINFSSYNYLGMSGDKEVNEAAKAAVEKFGTSVSASRLVSGEKTIHAELEATIASFIGVESALVFVGGHSTNETTIGHLFGQGDLILHDALSHNSIIQGAILSGARRRPFPHNDWRTLNDLLRELRRDYRRVLVVVEGVYSMDGDYPDLPKFVEAKDRHQAFLMVDEAHSMGTMGATGRGISEFFGVDPSQVDIWMGTLSKSFGSCGGYIAGRKEMVEYLKYTAPGFVYSVGLSPPNSAAAMKAIQILQRQPERAIRCIERGRLFAELARKKNLDIGFSRNTPIVPVITGNSVIALQLSHQLFQRGINVQPILYPAVEETAARLRFFITSTHTEEQIHRTVEAVSEELNSILGAGIPEVGTQPSSMQQVGS